MAWVVGVHSSLLLLQLELARVVAPATTVLSLLVVERERELGHSRDRNEQARPAITLRCHSCSVSIIILWTYRSIGRKLTLCSGPGPILTISLTILLTILLSILLFWQLFYYFSHYFAGILPGFCWDFAGILLGFCRDFAGILHFAGILPGFCSLRASANLLVHYFGRGWFAFTFFASHALLPVSFFFIFYLQALMIWTWVMAYGEQNSFFICVAAILKP